MFVWLNAGESMPICTTYTLLISTSYPSQIILLLEDYHTLHHGPLASRHFTSVPGVVGHRLRRT
jgi:hypothetical protein